MSLGDTMRAVIADVRDVISEYPLTAVFISFVTGVILVAANSL